MVIIGYFPLTTVEDYGKPVTFDDRNSKLLRAKAFADCGTSCICDVAAFSGPSGSVWIVPSVELEG